jgi:N-acetyl-alpha-D-muramate 1-phosphate uridylyltransferase
MKAMILAAGLGSRMRPLTDHTPKPLLKVGGQYLIAHHLHHLASAGITDVVINHSYLGEQIVRALKDGSEFGLNIQYSAEPERLETGGGIFKALPMLGDQPFIVINGDVWSDYPLIKLISKQYSQVHLVLVNNPTHHPTGDFALSEGKVLASGKQQHTYSGIGVYSKKFFLDCGPGAFPLAPLLRAAMHKRQVSGELYDGKWVDVGTPERLNELDQQLG